MDDQVGVEHHKAGTLEEEDQLDPDEMCFSHVTTEPAENKDLVFKLIKPIFKPFKLLPLLADGFG